MIDVLGLAAALFGKAIGVEYFHRRQKKKLLAAEVIEGYGGSEHSGEPRPLPKLLSGPVE